MALLLVCTTQEKEEVSERKGFGWTREGRKVREGLRKRTRRKMTRRRRTKAPSLPNSVCWPDTRLTMEPLCLCTSVSVLTSLPVFGCQEVFTLPLSFLLTLSSVSAFCCLFLSFSFSLQNGQTHTHANMTNTKKFFFSVFSSSFSSFLPLSLVPLLAPSHSLLPSLL